MTRHLVPVRGGSRHAALPVSKLDDLAAKARKLRGLRRRIDGACDSPPILPALPAHAVETIATIKNLSVPVTAGVVIDGYSVLTSMYGSRGDPEVAARIMVELLQAEGVTVIAVYSAIIALLRPVPGKEPSHYNDFQGKDAQPRRFLPTPSEILIEARSQDARWRDLLERIEDLPQRHAARIGGGE